MSRQVNILCMKWGKAYGPEYVNILYGMCKRNLSIPFRFICFTDDETNLSAEIEVFPLPNLPVPEEYRYSPWLKLSMFAKELHDLSGQALFLDLDLVITESIDCFFEYGDPEDFCIIENWTQAGRGIGNSSVYRFEIGKFSYVYDQYVSCPLNICKIYDNEQIYLSRAIAAHKDRINFWPAEWCKSFKRHAIGKWPISFFKEAQLPKGTKIMVFHGYPKPHNAISGKWPGKPWKSFKPVAWIGNYWSA